MVMIDKANIIMNDKGMVDCTTKENKIRPMMEAYEVNEDLEKFKGEILYK
jgi:hypothetical protein